MTTKISRASLLPEQSFIWKNPETTNHPAFAEISAGDVPNLQGVKKMLVFSAGALAFGVTLIDCQEVYSEFLELTLHVSEKEAASIKKFMAKLKEIILEREHNYAVISGGGLSGLLDIRVVGTYKSGYDAEDKWREIRDRLARKDFTVLTEEGQTEPLLCLEEGVQLLTSITVMTEDEKDYQN